MPLSAEEIRANLTRFVARWSVRDGYERGEAQTFLTELFDCKATSGEIRPIAGTSAFVSSASELKAIGFSSCATSGAKAEQQLEPGLLLCPECTHARKFGTYLGHILLIVRFVTCKT